MHGRETETIVNKQGHCTLSLLGVRGRVRILRGFDRPEVLCSRVTRYGNFMISGGSLK
jgi:hypothetical protein